MIEHDPWVGPQYAGEGIRGQRLGIVGYSAWTDNDHPGYTIESVSNVVSGAWPKVQFFNAIAGYFGMDRADFYNRIVLFEFVPCSVGGGDQRYAFATVDQLAVGRERVLRIAREQAVDKLLVFSGKAWAGMPPVVESPGQRPRLGDTKFEYGHYQLDDRRVTAVGLRHPQYAPGKLMRGAVELALALPVDRLAFAA